MKYKSKWGLIGINPQQLKKIYDSNRLKAKEILKKKYNKEYSFILSQLMNKVYIEKAKENFKK
jgi:hypothetical protein